MGVTQTQTDSIASGAQSRLMAARTQLVAMLLAFHNALVEVFDLERAGHAPVDAAQASEMGVMDAVKMVGGAVIGIAVITLVVNQVLTVGAINNSSGPFTAVINSLETTGVAAMTLLVVGLLVVSASYIMRYMEGF